MGGYLSVLDGRGFLFLSLAFFALFTSVGFNYGMNVYDEGITTYGAVRILVGDVPYGDFWTMYPPGQFYLLAGLFMLFGVSLLAERILSVILMLALAIVVFLIIRSLTSQKYALLGVLILLSWMITGSLFSSPILTGIFTATSGIYFLMKYLRGGPRRDLIVAGFLSGATVVFRHDIGFYTVVVALLILVPFVLFGSRFSNPPNKRSGLTDPAWFILTVGLVVLPVAGLLLMIAPGKVIWNDLIVFPATVFPAVRSVQSPDIIIASGRIPLYFPFIIIVISTISLLVKVVRKQISPSGEIFWIEALLIGITLTWLLQASVRFDAAHLFPAYVPATILFTIIFFKGPSNKIIRIVIPIMGLWISYLIIAPGFRTQAEVLNNMTSVDRYVFSAGPACGIIWDERGEELDDLMRYLRKNMSGGEYLFSGSARHDKIFVNNILIYTLSGLRSPTKYHELSPGVVTEKEVQDQIVQDLIEKDVGYLVLMEPQHSEQNQSNISSGIVILDDFIRNKYQPAESFGIYSVWKLNDEDDILAQ